MQKTKKYRMLSFSFFYSQKLMKNVPYCYENISHDQSELTQELQAINKLHIAEDFLNNIKHKLTLNYYCITKRTNILAKLF